LVVLLRSKAPEAARCRSAPFEAARLSFCPFRSRRFVVPPTRLADALCTALSLVGSKVGAMFDHVAIQVADIDASAQLFGDVLAPLGIREGVRIPTPNGPVVGFAGPDGALQFWLSGVEKVADNRELHIAFRTDSRDQVDQVFAAVRAAGAEVLHEPRVFPEYHEHYYGVFFRDLDGNNVEAVCHLPA
jgi:catechol 2,3-dioxygenase-like lactoylglutathione lyase family enzyme